jgi:hypothetical protein
VGAGVGAVSYFSLTVCCDAKITGSLESRPNMMTDSVEQTA